MINKKLTYIVLAIFLILIGLISFLPSFDSISFLIPILAIAAAILIFIATPKISLYAGWILTGVYLLLTGLIGLINFSFSGLGVIMAILALISGILLISRLTKIGKHVGILLLSCWLILVGATRLLGFSSLDTIIAGFALAAGVMLFKE